MHVQFAGCGDAFGSGGRFNTCFHVVGAEVNFLIDCGASSLVALKRCGINRNAIDAILITHFHADHFGGIPPFMLDAQFIARRERPLTIAGPRGLPDWYARAMETAFPGSSATKQRFPLVLQELTIGDTADVGRLRVTPYPVQHDARAGPCLALRIEAEGRTLAYSGDTEWTETLIDAGREADLFICEAYTREKSVKAHLPLAVLAQHLTRIAPKRLILTHMSEDMLTQRTRLAYERAEDGLTVEI
jgi:ribonuclease BN (tRNA processing enzyme)